MASRKSRKRAAAVAAELQAQTNTTVLSLARPEDRAEAVAGKLREFCMSLLLLYISCARQAWCGLCSP